MHLKYVMKVRQSEVDEREGLVCNARTRAPPPPTHTHARTHTHTHRRERGTGHSRAEPQLRKRSVRQDQSLGSLERTWLGARSALRVGGVHALPSPLGPQVLRGHGKGEGVRVVLHNLIGHDRVELLVHVRRLVRGRVSGQGESSGQG